MNLTVAIYQSTAGFPKHEIYGLAQQLRRAAVSVANKITEGKGHRSTKKFLHFLFHALFHARGSILEVQTQLLIASELRYLPETDRSQLLERAEGAGPALSGLITSRERNVA